jgi:hypothetical protein
MEIRLIGLEQHSVIYVETLKVFPSSMSIICVQKF